jgi:hypothetical protein
MPSRPAQVLAIKDEVEGSEEMNVATANLVDAEQCLEPLGLLQLITERRLRPQ